MTESWKRPSGGLYVLDSRVTDSRSRILTVDPGRLATRIIANLGYDAMMALSADGRVLYVASTFREGDLLLGIDTKTGRLLSQVQLHDRWLDTMRPRFPTIVVTPDRRYVLILTMRTITAGTDRYALSVYDIKQDRLVSDLIPLGNCGYAAVLPTSGSGQIVTVCNNSGLVLFSGISKQGEAVTTQSVPLPRPASTGQVVDTASPWGLAGAAISRDGRLLYVVNTSGSVLVLDTHSKTIVRQAQLVVDQWGAWIPQSGIILSQDGTRLVMLAGTSMDRDRAMSRGLIQLDAANMLAVSRIELGEPIWTIAASDSLDKVYALAPDMRELLLVDLGGPTPRILGTILNIGVSPVLAIPVA